MSFLVGNEQDVLRRRLSVVDHLPAADVVILESLAWTLSDIPARHEFVREGSVPTSCCLVVDGVSCRYNDLRSGSRQIHALHVPGDMPDLLSLHLTVMDHSMATVSPCRIATVSHEELRRVCAASPMLAAALWRETLIDAAIGRATILRLGRLSATERLAHLICEMRLRFEAIGAVTDNTFRLPVTQEMLGEILGMTTVSVNRCIQELRTRELAQIDRANFAILDWNGLVRLGQFDPTYLHIRE